MTWETQSVTNKIKLLETAQQLVIMSVCKKPMEVRNQILKVRYQADEIMCDKFYGTDPKYNDKLLEYEIIAYLLALGSVFKGDLYGYFMSYLDKAYDYLHKSPSGARTGSQSDDGDLDEYSAEEKNKGADDDSEP